MPTERNPKLFDFAPIEGRRVVAAFDGGAITSDAGALLLGETDRAIRLRERFASCFTDVRVFAPPNPAVTLWLEISAGVASAALVFRRRAMGPSLRQGFLLGTPRPIRGATDNHGHAEWLSMARAREVFPGPCPEFGGIVVGQTYRVDQKRGCGCGVRSGEEDNLGKGRQGSLAR